jgi:hypothetical protein
MSNKFTAACIKMLFNCLTFLPGTWLRIGWYYSYFWPETRICWHILCLLSADNGQFRDSLCSRPSTFMKLNGSKTFIQKQLLNYWHAQFSLKLSGRNGWKSWFLLKHRNACASHFHLVVCLMTGPKPLPKRALHIVRSRASSFKWEYPFLSLSSSSSFLRLLRHLPVTSIPNFIFPSITRFRRQFLRKMWPIQLALFHAGYSSAPWL